jgi:hypothetical protein
VQDDTEFAHRAKATRNRWALVKPFKSKGEAARDLRRHATIALGNDAFWPASVLVKVGLMHLRLMCCVTSGVGRA